MIFQEWRRKRRQEKEARRLVRDIFANPSLLKGTSLSRRHAARTVVLSHDVEGGAVVRVEFGIVRHPRPYAFSRQSHKVLEIYCYDIVKKKVVVQKGVNLTRAEGLDAD